MSPSNRRRGRKAKQPIPDADSFTSTISSVEQLLHYTFRDPALLQEALTHPSISPCHYRRLAFVGDAALDLAFANHFFRTDPGLGSDRLTFLRSANVSTEKLARVAVRCDLYPRLRRYNTHKLDHLVGLFTEEVRQEPEELGGHPYGGSTIEAPKVLADIVESIAAAVYVDCNFDLEMLWKIIRVILEPIVTVETLDEQPVTKLNELCQEHQKQLEFNHSWKGSFNIWEYLVDGELVGVGSAGKKSIAKLNAARDALQRLEGTESYLLTSRKIPLTSNEPEEKEEWTQKLNVLCAKKHWEKPAYEIEKEQGSGHKKQFLCSVRVNTSEGTFTTLGDLKSRVKPAKNAAAFKMLSEVLKNLI